MDLQVWNVSHDGIIVSVSGRVPGDLIFVIEIAWLREEVSDSGHSFLLRALRCDHLSFFGFLSNQASEGVEALQGISLEILNARLENNRIVVTTVAGLLNLHCADESIEIDGGRKLDLFELNAAAERACRGLS